MFLYCFTNEFTFNELDRRNMHHYRHNSATDSDSYETSHIQATRRDKNNILNNNLSYP